MDRAERLRLPAHADVGLRNRRMANHLVRALNLTCSPPTSESGFALYTSRMPCAAITANKLTTFKNVLTSSLAAPII